ncbi:MAG: ORF6N domain-containing protein [Bacteroidales bacterium]|nr:ORF6N domain-containing protein [Bacteroidales bacterium]
MSEQRNKVMIPDEVILSKIYLVRGKKIMIDRDLAELYGVETKYLKRQVKRNINRFPEDFMFELNKEEFDNWRCQNVTSNADRQGLRYAPFAFTEHGVLMLSSVLNSEKAVETNIQIIRIFNKMREMINSHKELFIELEKIKSQIHNHDEKLMIIFEYLKQFEETKHKQFEQLNRRRIGFKSSED